MDLPVKYKAFWFYICDSCDCAGVWEPNMRLAVAQIGEPLELIEILRVFVGRIQQLNDGKLWITKFIEFQYGILSPDCKPHIPVLKRLDSLGLSKGYPKGINTLKEKDKEKDKEGGVRGGFRKPSLNELSQILGSLDMANDFWDYYESNGWRVGRNPMRDWKSSARRWKRTNGKNQRHIAEGGRTAGTLNEGKTEQYEGVGKISRLPNPQ